MQISLIKNEQGVDEWLMIEMQGSIENGCAPFSGEMIGKGLRRNVTQIGNIGWRKDGSEALFLIGHHLLEGKVHKLEKPFLVASPNSNLEGEKSLIINAIIRRRLVFKNRPKPIVTKTLVKKSSLLQNT